MDTRELDRLVSKTELNPVSKALLRKVRKASLKGQVLGPFMSKYEWSVVVDGVAGNSGAKLTFKMKRVNGSKENSEEA